LFLILVLSSSAFSFAVGPFGALPLAPPYSSSCIVYNMRLVIYIAK
jgi:hypothetical protein